MCRLIIAMSVERQTTLMQTGAECVIDRGELVLRVRP